MTRPCSSSGYGPGHVGDQEVDTVQALADIGEVVGDGGRVAALVELAQEFNAREVHVVPRVGADGGIPRRSGVLAWPWVGPVLT